MIDVCDLIDFWMSIFIRKRKRLTFSHFLFFSLFWAQEKSTKGKSERETKQERERGERGERDRREKQRLLLTEREKTDDEANEHL